MHRVVKTMGTVSVVVEGNVKWVDGGGGGGGGGRKGWVK